MLQRQSLPPPPPITKRRIVVRIYKADVVTDFFPSWRMMRSGCQGPFVCLSS